MMTDVPARDISHRLGRFASESLNYAGQLALALLLAKTILRGSFTTAPGPLLAIVVGVGVLRTAVVWMLKARLRARWPAAPRPDREG